MSQTPPTTVAQAKAELQNWENALEVCSTGQTYSIAGRSLTRQDVEAVIMPAITRAHRKLMALEQAAAGNQRPLGASASFPRPGSGVGPVGIYPQSLWTDWRS